MKYIENIINKVEAAFGVEAIHELDFEAVSLVLKGGQKVVAWCLDAVEETGYFILLLPFEVETWLDEDGSRSIIMNKMNPFSDDIYHPIKAETVLSAGYQHKAMLELYEGAADAWLKSYEEENSQDEEEGVDEKSDNIVHFISKKLH